MITLLLVVMASWTPVMVVQVSPSYPTKIACEASADAVTGVVQHKVDALQTGGTVRAHACLSRTEMKRFSRKTGVFYK